MDIKVLNQFTLIVTTDDDHQQKKLRTGNLYHQYLQRTGPSAPGCKNIPDGKPGCLAGLSFLITGELESQTRTAATNLIESLGGVMKTTVSKKLHYLIVGETGAGPAKLAKAKELGISKINEDGLLDLIEETSKEDFLPI